MLSGGFYKMKPGLTSTFFLVSDTLYISWFTLVNFLSQRLYYRFNSERKYDTAFAIFYITYIIQCKIKRDNHQVPEIVSVRGNKTNPNKIRIKIYK